MLSFKEFIKSCALNESEDRLDISILNADKYLTSEAKYAAFFNTPVTVEAKTDGVKVTAVKVSNDGDINDWVIAYKGHILYSHEFEYQSDAKVKTDSIGSSQFKLLLKHFENIGANSIPVNTELQLEFLMKKPTLSSNYVKSHGIVLIGYSKSTYSTEYGILKTANTGMNTELRDAYAKELKLSTPLKLFDGILSSEVMISRGILQKDLKKSFERNKNALNWKDFKILYEQIKDIFLEVPSAFGGKEEGVVLKFNNGLILKLQQVYQTDQKERAKIKARYREDDQTAETQYWTNVKSAAYELANAINPGTRKLDDILRELSTDLKRLKLNFTHSKKNEVQIKDDIQLNAKTLIIKNMKGNAGCLILGKFRILTAGHAKLIKAALRNYDRVAIAVVSSKANADTKDLREQMIRKTFGNKVTIITASNGNLIRLLDKVPFNVNYVYAGSDRVSEYTKQLENTLGVSVKEMFRTSTDISATKVIENLDDEKFFKANTPKEIHEMYNDLRNTYAN